MCFLYFTLYGGGVVDYLNIIKGGRDSKKIGKHWGSKIVFFQYSIHLMWDLQYFQYLRVLRKTLFPCSPK